MPNGDQEIGPCAHDTRTCEWVCPKTFGFASSLRMQFPHGELKVLEGLDESLEYDAMVFSTEAYDKFVLPSQIERYGYATALKHRRNHAACLRRYGVCIHLLDCTWICPKVIRAKVVAWNTEGNSKVSLRDAIDAIVLTPSAYERFALPFQVIDKGAARAYASYTVYLSRVRTRRALERRP